MMNIVTEGQRTGQHLLSEASLYRSRADAVFAPLATDLEPGTVVAKGAGGVDAFPLSGNTGNGTITGVAAGASPVFGAYLITCSDDTAGAQKFYVTVPGGEVLPAQAEVGTAFTSDYVNFTIDAGTTDFVAGDQFQVILYEAGWAAYDAGGGGGINTAAGVLLSRLPASDTSQSATVHVRDCEVIGDMLHGLDDAAKGQLEQVGIIVRPAYQPGRR